MICFTEIQKEKLLYCIMSVFGVELEAATEFLNLIENIDEVEICGIT